MSKTTRLLELKDALGALISSTQGPLETTLSGVRSLEKAEAGFLVFAADERGVQSALSSKAAAFVFPENTKPEFRKDPRPILFSKNVGLVQAQSIARFFAPPRWTSSGISERATISPNAKIGPEVTIEAGAWIGDEVTIARGARIGANAVLRERAHVGERTEVWPMVFIGADTQVGADCILYPNSSIAKEGYGFAHDEKGNHFAIPQIGRVVIEDSVTIGANCTIDRAAFDETRIAAGTKLDNLIHIAHNCSVGKNSLLTAGCMMAGSSHLGDNVVVGGGVRVTDHVTVASGVQIAGMSGVSKDITEAGAYGGFPLEPMRDYLRTRTAIGHLAQMRKQLQAVLKKLGMSEEE